MIPSISSTIDSADRLKSSWEHKWVNENRLASLLEYHRYTQDSPPKNGKWRTKLFTSREGGILLVVSEGDQRMLNSMY